MKNALLFCLALLLSQACQQLAPATTAPQQVAPEANAAPTEQDLPAIGDLIHGFYRWYGASGTDWQAEFLDDRGEHLKLDPTKLGSYCQKLRSSGFVSDDFIEAERVRLKKCEQAWQNEPKDDVPNCLDADRFYCAQDWDEALWTQGKVRLGADAAGKPIIVLYNDSEQREFEVRKVNGRWLISQIACDMGLE